MRRRIHLLVVNIHRYARLYPQEIASSVFFVGMIAWFLGLHGFSEPLVWGFIALLAVGVFFSRQRGKWERARLLYGALALAISYYLLGGAVPLLNPLTLDPVLQRADAAIFGGQPALMFEPFARPWLTEILSVCYLLYYPWIACAVLYYATRALPVFRAFCAGAFTILALGCILYALLPATGPIFQPALAAQFSAPLSGFLFTPLLDTIVALGCNRVDAFPSIHCALTLFFLSFEKARHPRCFRLLLIPVIGLLIATVYLRYHYFTDLLIGALVAWIGVRIARSREPVEP